MSLEQSIKQRALEIGFDLVGVAPVGVAHDLDFARRWVEQGRGGEMNYLRNPKRHDPRQVLPSVQSVVCVGLVYNAPLPYSTAVHRPAKPQGAEAEEPREKFLPCSESSNAGLRPPPVRTGWISRYAWGRDYHKVMKQKLEALRAGIEATAPGVETRVYIDTGPIVERAFARFSGIGWMGKNTCLIHQEKGSWFFLGVILTSLPLTQDFPAPDRCGSCRRCIEACPTGALNEPYVMDASRCIAYLTIELKGPVPTQFREAVGVNVFGCDICQDVCPWNSGQTANGVPGTPSHPQTRRVAVTNLLEFQPKLVSINRGKKAEPSGADHREPAPRPPAYHRNPPVSSNRVESEQDELEAGASLCLEFPLFNPPLSALAAMTEEDFLLNFRDSPLKRAKFQGFIRNLCIALGNSGNLSMAPFIQQFVSHENPVIREHAVWALKTLEKTSLRRNRGL